MKILFVLEYYYPHIGGVEKLFKGLADALAEQGNDVTVVTTKFRKGLKKIERKHGVKIIRLNTRSRFGFTLFGIPTVYQLAKRADIIHTTSYNAAIPAYIAGRLRKKKMYITFHEVWGELWKTLPFLGWWQRWGYGTFERFILRLKFDRFIAVSDFTAKKLAESDIPPERILTIYNGIDYAYYKNIRHTNNKNKFVVTFYGRLGVSKGFDLLIPAFAEASRDKKNMELKLIIPRQPETILWEVNRLIKKYRIGEQVVVHHELEKDVLFKEVSSSDCVAIPSYSEGFCFVAAECAAMEVPMISSGKGALKEVVSGKFVEMESMNISALATAINKAYNGDWSQRPLRIFKLNETIKNYLKLYSGT